MLDISCLTSLINENVIISKKDLEYNMNLWKPGKKNILYITGLSGSGKSTLAQDMCKQKNAKYIDLDRLVHAYNFKNNPRVDRADEIMIADYVNKNRVAKDPAAMSDGEYLQYILDCFGYMVEMMHKHSGQLYVVEGLQLIRLAKNRYSQEIFTSPLIIKETSVIKSIIRRIRRAKNMLNDPEWVEDIEDAKAEISSWKSLDGIMTHLNWYFDVEYGLNWFRKDAASINSRR